MNLEKKLVRVHMLMLQCISVVQYMIHFSKIRNIYFTLRRCNIELDVDSKRACANAYGKYIGVV